MSGSVELDDLLRQAKAARAASDDDATRAAFAASFARARELGDAPGMAEAALGLAGVHTYGMHPGRVPAFLREAHDVAEGPAKIRLAVAIVRAWAYSGAPERGADFADRAVTEAERSDDPTLLAEALDAQLLVHWGPDDLAARLAITSRLEDTVAYVSDVEARLSAHLWRLTTAVENLDVTGVVRQLRALDRLATESGSPRVRFFASARNAMHAIVVGDLDTARRLRDEAIRAGSEAREPDTFAIGHVLAADVARRAGDVDRLRSEAAVFEEFGTTEGAATVLAEAAGLWLAAGEHARAHDLLVRIAGAGFDVVPRNMDWLLVVSILTGVAAHTDERALVAEGLRLLEPYAGRGVPNGGAASFAGVVDGYLSVAAAASERPDDAERWARSGRELAARFGAEWWIDQLTAPRGDARRALPITAYLRPDGNGIWTIGVTGSTVPVREMKGFAYLRLLLRQPGVDITALDLSDWAAGHAGRGLDQTGTGEVIDRQALEAYRARIAELDEEIAEAQQWADQARLPRLRAEREALLDEVGAATGLGGRARRSGATAERARVAVRKAVAAAIERIATVDPALARLLRDCVQTGHSCRYDRDPARPVQWLTDGSG